VEKIFEERTLFAWPQLFEVRRQAGPAHPFDDRAGPSSTCSTL